MTEQLENLLPRVPSGKRPALAIFMSGQGSNAEVLLEDAGLRECCDIRLLVSDSRRSNAAALAERFHVPLAELDIREFYAAHGESRVTLATAPGRAIRELWTDALRQLVAPAHVDFGVLAGFASLTNLTGELPCLNVHPGDLSVVAADGRRKYIGLHRRPIELALLDGQRSLRASVILAAPYSGAGGDMDNGLLLGISEPVAVDFGDATLAMLQADAARRNKMPRPATGWGDRLNALAQAAQTALKFGGDHKLLAPVVRDFAAGRFAQDAAGRLYYRDGEAFAPVSSVPVYRRDGTVAML